MTRVNAATNTFSSLPAPSQDGYQGCAHVQCLWAAYGSERRQGVPNLNFQALRGTISPSYGDTSQSRSFNYPDDMIEDFVRMMNSEPGFIGAVNLGNPAAFTMLELAESVLMLTGSQSKLTFKPLPTDDPRQQPT